MPSPTQGRERVSAGIPGLSPFLRASIERVERTRDFSRTALINHTQQETATAAPDGGEDTTNLLRQMGRPLSSQQVIQRLEKMNHSLLFERSRADETKMGVYVLENRTDPVTGTWRCDRRFLCGMEAGFMPEFSVRHCDWQEVPDPDTPGHWKKVPKFTRETRGWRTVLARLLREHLITAGQVQKYFDTDGGRSSERWQLLTT